MNVASHSTTHIHDYKTCYFLKLFRCNFYLCDTVTLTVVYDAITHPREMMRMRIKYVIAFCGFMLLIFTGGNFWSR